jgi:carbonic anhydrase/acetyltransferase-like protein (isoleucine patch superfamily)
VVGDGAHDAAVSGNPVLIGLEARSSDGTAVASGDAVRAQADLNGKQVVMPYAIPENFVSGAITTAMTATTSTSLVAAPSAGRRNYITTIIVSNAHATVGTDVIIQDGSGGTTLLTIPAAAVYGGAVITLPTPLRQPTTATAIYCANVTTGASTKVSAVGYTAP